MRQVREFAMLPVTRWFGVTFSDEERSLKVEKACIDEIVERVPQMQAQAAAGQRRPLARGTHAKRVVARAKFEVFDGAAGREPALAARLANGIFAKPGVYPATVRFANADSKVNSDFKADVRALPFSVDLTRGGSEVQETGIQRQNFSLQNTTVLPLSDARTFLATMKFLTASNPAKGFATLSLRDQLRVLRALALVEVQTRQMVRPYQRLRYWSNVPYRHGATNFVKQSASPSPNNPARPLKPCNLVVATIVQLGGARAFVRRHLLRVFEQAAVEQIDGDPGRPERVTPQLGDDPGGERTPHDHSPRACRAIRSDPTCFRPRPGAPEGIRTPGLCVRIAFGGAGVDERRILCNRDPP
jgi:hypothetical protein